MNKFLSEKKNNLKYNFIKLFELNNIVKKNEKSKCNIFNS